MSFVPRRPDMRLVLVDRNHTKRRLEAGIAYKNEAGGFNLRLNPGVVIRWNDEVYLTLWPDDGKPAGTRRKDVERAAVESEADDAAEKAESADDSNKINGGEDEDDGIPF